MFDPIMKDISVLMVMVVLSAFTVVKTCEFLQAVATKLNLYWNTFSTLVVLASEHYTISTVCLFAVIALLVATILHQRHQLRREIKARTQDRITHKQDLEISQSSISFWATKCDEIAASLQRKAGELADLQQHISTARCAHDSIRITEDNRIIHSCCSRLMVIKQETRIKKEIYKNTKTLVGSDVLEVISQNQEKYTEWLEATRNPYAWVEDRVRRQANLRIDEARREAAETRRKANVQLATVASAYTVLQSDFEIMEMGRDKFSRSLKEKIAAIIGLKRELCLKQDEIEGLQATLSRASADSIDGLVASKQDLVATSEGLRQELSSMQSELKVKDNEITALRDREEKAKNRVEELKTTHVNKVMELESKLQAWEDDFSDAAAEHTKTLNLALVQCEGDKAMLQSDITKLQSKVDSLAHNISNMTASSKEKDSQIVSLQRDVQARDDSLKTANRAGTERKDSQNQVRDRDDTILSLQEQVKSLTSKLSQMSLAQSLSAKESSIEKQEKWSAKIAECDQLRRTGMELEKQLKDVCLPYLSPDNADKEYDELLRQHDLSPAHALSTLLSRTQAMVNEQRSHIEAKNSELGTERSKTQSAQHELGLERAKVKAMQAKHQAQTVNQERKEIRDLMTGDAYKVQEPQKESKTIEKLLNEEGGSLTKKDKPIVERIRSLMWKAKEYHGVSGCVEFHKIDTINHETGKKFEHLWQVVNVAGRVYNDAVALEKTMNERNLRKVSDEDIKKGARQLPFTHRTRLIFDDYHKVGRALEEIWTTTQGLTGQVVRTNNENDIVDSVQRLGKTLVDVLGKNAGRQGTPKRARAVDDE